MAKLNSTTYTNVVGNTVDNAVLDAAKILAWRQDIKAVVDGNDDITNGKVSKSGDTMTGPLINNSSIGINASAGNSKDYYFSTSGSLRWILRAEATAESGSNAGSNFQILRRSDAGGSLGISLDINRATGVVTMNGKKFIVGTGSPEGVVTGNVGDEFTRTNGGASTTMYIKESGTGNTGWVAK